MQLTYQFDVEGYWLIQRAIFRQLALEPDTRIAKGWLVFAVGVMAALAVTIGHIKLGDQARTASFLVIALVIAALQLYRSYYASLRTALGNYAKVGVSGCHVVEFDDNSIKVISPQGEVLVYWSAVARIACVQNTLVFIGSSVFGVPLNGCSDGAGNAIDAGQIISTVQSLSGLQITNRDAGG